MKALLAGLAVAVLLVSAAQADKQERHPAARLVNTSNCSVTIWPAISPVQCHERMAKDYESCRKYVIEHGETGASASRWCTSQGYTK
jgi:hypothetical protein